MPLLLSLALAVSAAGTAFALRTLTLDGAVAAAVIGSATIAAGWAWALPLLAFFAGSSLLSRFGPSPNEDVAKTGARDAAQVLANGGIPTSAALAHLIQIPGPWALVCASSLAAANADTWATEFGKFSRLLPRLITSGRRVSPGVSGGITPLGTTGAVAGSLTITVIALASTLVSPVQAVDVALAGVGGALIDSVLGATVQERRWCPVCAALTEQTEHRPCGTGTDVAGGVPRLNNDAVNLLAGASGAVLAVLIGRII
jgi:uncharacterized protein (TIGR00297 family)